MKLLIKNGLVVNADSSIVADILCVNGKIHRIATNISEHTADTIIDATGKYVIPGGIDPHVHMHLPSPAGFSADDFYSGTKAALMGGTTTLIDFVTPNRQETLLEALQKRKEEATNSLIDYSFHISPIQWTDTTEQEIKICIEQEGITSFKIYMAYKKSIGLSDDIIQKILQVVAKYGGLVTSHCELGDVIDKKRDEFISEGKTSPEFHPLSRPAHLEAEAVARLIQMARQANCPVYVVHVSTQQSIPFIKKAQEEGQPVFAETCPQYLLLNDAKYQGEFKETAPYVMSPPLRKKEDNAGLWKAVEQGVIHTLGTDHCPFMLKQKARGETDFTQIPNGAGGVEHRLTLSFTYGVLQEKISLNEWVALTSTNVAKLFGLFPQKGIIQEGADADLVIWNPDIEQKIAAKTHHSNADSNIFEGFMTKGKPEYVITKGKIRVIDNVLQEESQIVNFLKRERPSLI